MFATLPKLVPSGKQGRRRTDTFQLTFLSRPVHLLGRLDTAVGMTHPHG